MRKGKITNPERDTDSRYYRATSISAHLLDLITLACHYTPRPWPVGQSRPCNVIINVLHCWISINNAVTANVTENESLELNE